MCREGRVDTSGASLHLHKEGLQVFQYAWNFGWPLLERRSPLKSWRQIFTQASDL